MRKMVPGTASAVASAPDEQTMDANGVAREFWTEVLDTRTPVDDPRRRRATKARRKKVRVVAPPGRPLRDSA